MDFDFLRSFPPATEEQIAGLERRLGAPVPPEYRAFLAVRNGAEPPPVHLRDPDDVGVHLFHGIGHSEYYFDIDYHLRVFADRIVHRSLPVARDAGGNIIYLSLDDGDYGHVYFWDHEGEAEDGEPPTTENVTFLRTGFQAFLDDLVPHSD